MWQEGVGEGILQVEDAARPAAAWSVVDGHGAPLELILVTHRSIGTINPKQILFAKTTEQNQTKVVSGRCISSTFHIFFLFTLLEPNRERNSSHYKYIMNYIIQSFNDGMPGLAISS